jgi:dTDP-4-dehydrorhamnose 3,5-epimerase-like enzyme
MLPDMEIIGTPSEDLIIFRPTPIRNERGCISRTLDVQILAEAGIDPGGFKQENQSRSNEGLRHRLHGRPELVRRSWSAVPMAPYLSELRPGDDLLAR